MGETARKAHITKGSGGVAAGGGRSEVKRSRAGSSHGEPRTEPRPPRRRSRWIAIRVRCRIYELECLNGVAARLEDVPRSPGVYIMSDARGRCCTWGRRRICAPASELFGSRGGRAAGDPEPRHAGPGDPVHRTATEKEALLLENTLIKRHRPPSTSFSATTRSICSFGSTGTRRSAPELVRRAARDGATYFGPYSSARGIRETVRELLRLFPLCSARGGSSPPDAAVPQLPDGEVPRRVRRPGREGAVPPRRR